MFEEANQIFINDLQTIEEMQTHIPKLKFQSLESYQDDEELDLSLSLYVSEVIFFIYSRRDKQTACSVSISDVKFKKENG